MRLIPDKIKHSIIKSRSSAYGRNAVRNRFEDIKNKINTDTPVIIDAGANCGSIIDLFLKQYKNPEILAFEPIPDLFEILNSKYSNKRNIQLFNLALGEKNSISKFNITNRPSSSSIYKPTNENVYYHGDELLVSRIVDVEVKKLSNFIKNYESIDIMKLDVQGFELSVMKGAEKYLKNIKTITAEVEFIPMYKSQPLFAEIDIFLRLNGFSLLNLYEIWTHKDGQIEAADSVYINKRFF